MNMRHRRIILGVLPLAVSLSACAQVVSSIGGSVLQHSIGSAVGPCRAAMDSLERTRGKPWRTYRSDETEGSSIRFWYEWAYRERGADSTELADVVRVTGFLWEGGDDRCDVRERLAVRPGALGMPWSDAGRVPAPR